MIQIKNRFSGEVIHTDETAETLRDAAIRYVATKRDAGRSADLRSADLRYANLRSANLRYADLSYANLRSANLRYADLHSADLRYADLRYADLSYANLSYANLRSANLRYADLPSPTAVLLATWGDLSQQLCADLMLFDSQNHPDPTAFDRWAKRENSACPYSGVKVQRAANFSERKEFWGQGQACRPYDLMVRLLAEKCPEWTKEQRKEFAANFKKQE